MNERGLLGLVAVGNEGRQQMHDEVQGTAVVRMLDLADVLELIIDCLDSVAVVGERARSSTRSVVAIWQGVNDESRSQIVWHTVT